jgi:hypothetical protein
MAATADVKQVWEAAVASDTPFWRDNLRALEEETSEMQRSVAHLLKVSQAYTAASEAQAEARRDMVEAVLSTANDAFQHADLAGSTGTEQLGAMRDLFEQMGVAHDMERQQVQSLLIEPLQAMIDDPKGLASGERLFSTFTSLSHDFYEALSEFLSLEGEGANATAARAHAKTQAKAAAKMGSAVMSQAASRVGTGFGFLSRKLNQQLGVDLGLGAAEAPDAPPSAAAAAEEEEDGAGGGGPSVGDMAREAYSGIKQAGSHAHAVHDTEARVLRQQEALLKTRHAMEVRLLDTSQRGRLQLARQLVDLFYAQYTLAAQQNTLVTRHEAAARGLQQVAEDVAAAQPARTAALKRRGAQVGALCAALGAPPSEVAVPLSLLSAMCPVLPSTAADEAAAGGVAGGAGGGDGGGGGAVGGALARGEMVTVRPSFDTSMLSKSEIGSRSRPPVPLQGELTAELMAPGSSGARRSVALKSHWSRKAALRGGRGEQARVSK